MHVHTIFGMNVVRMHGSAIKIVRVLSMLPNLVNKIGTSNQIKYSNDSLIETYPSKMSYTLSINVLFSLRCCQCVINFYVFPLL